MIKYLVWDSTFFQKKIGKLIESAPYTLNSLILDLDRSKKLSYDCVYADIDLKRKHLHQWLKQNGISPIKNHLHLTKNINKDFISKNNSIFSRISKTHIDTLYDLAVQLSRSSRFFTDSHFRPFSSSLYKKWIFKTITSPSNHQYFINVKNGVPQGFASLVFDGKCITIDLFIVDHKIRRQKIGSSLLNSVFSWTKEKGYNHLNVVTQDDNLPAKSFYYKHGFELKKETYIYHLWNR